MTYDQRLKEARERNTGSYSAFRDTLLTDEVEQRNHAQLTRRLAKSMLNPNKTLETFDFGFNSKIRPSTI